MQRCPCEWAAGQMGPDGAAGQDLLRAAGQPTGVGSWPAVFVTAGAALRRWHAPRAAGPGPLPVRCLAAGGQPGPGRLLHVLRLAGPRELRRLEVVHNVRLHAGPCSSCWPRGLPRLVSTHPARQGLLAAPASTLLAAEGPARLRALGAQQDDAAHGAARGLLHADREAADTAWVSLGVTEGQGGGTSALSPSAQVRAAWGCAQTLVTYQAQGPVPVDLPSPEQPRADPWGGGSPAGTGVGGHPQVPCLKGHSPGGKERQES